MQVALGPYAFRHLGLPEPAGEKPQVRLFSEEDGETQGYFIGP
jgi:hypothetical protein